MKYRRKPITVGQLVAHTRELQEERRLCNDPSDDVDMNIHLGLIEGMETLSEGVRGAQEMVSTLLIILFQLKKHSKKSKDISNFVRHIRLNSAMEKALQTNSNLIKLRSDYLDTILQAMEYTDCLFDTIFLNPNYKIE